MNRQWSAAALWVLLSGTALAGDALFAPDGTSWRVEMGTTRLRYSEWVFMNMAPWNVSRLDWSATAPTLAADIEVPLSGGTSFGLGVETLLRHDGFMTDQDWMPPNFINFSLTNWTHQSWHDDTTMEGLAALTARLTQRVTLGDTSSAGLTASLGVKSVSFEARGGNWVYSNDYGPGFRTRQQDFVPGEKVISMDTLAINALIGADLKVQSGPFGLTLEGAGGVSFQNFRDRHWLRNFYMDGWLYPAPMLSAGLTASYDVSPDLAAYLNARYEKVFTTHGNRTDRQISDDAWLGDYDGAVGLDSDSLSLRLGLNGRFGEGMADNPPAALTSGQNGALAWAADLGVAALYTWEFVAPGRGTTTRAQATNWAAATPLFTLSGSADLGDGWSIIARAGAALPVKAMTEQVEIDDSFYSLNFNGRDFGTVDFAVDHARKDGNLLDYLEGGITLRRGLLSLFGADISLTGTAALDHAAFETRLQPDPSLPANGRISFALTTPKLLAGVSLAARPFGWDVTLDTAAGLAMGATSTREDSFRNQRVETKLEPQPIVAVDGSASTEVVPGLTAYLKGGLEVRFLTRGREEDYSLSGTYLGESDGGTGNFFAKAAVSAGIKGSF